MSVGVALLGLAVLILIHEAGHFFVARAVGMSPRKFYLGFPPAIAKIRRKGIEYGLGAIPLGGYVKIPGMHRPAPVDVDRYFGRPLNERPELSGRIGHLRQLFASGDVDGARPVLDALDEDLARGGLSPGATRDAGRGVRELRDALGADAYWRQRTWKKIAVIFAGPATNLVFAIALFAVLLMQDAYQVGIRLQADPARNVSSTIESVVEGTPAEAAGLRSRDRIVAVDGDPVTPRQLLDRIEASEGRPLTLTVVRQGERVRVGPLSARRRPGLSAPAAIGRSLDVTWRVTTAVGGFFPRLVRGEGREEVSSPLGITQASSQAYDRGLEEFLFILGLISLSLALLNLLPLLPLDGGHITFSVIEGLRGRAVGREVYERASAVGIVLVLMLFFIGLSNDVGRLSGG